MVEIHSLEVLGLSRAEAQVYLAILKLGSTLPVRVSDETGLRRSTVYDSLRRLRDKGLVSYIIKGKKSHFEATEPGKLLDFVEEQKRLIEEREKAAQSLIPRLRDDFATSRPRAQAHVLEGIEGFKAMRRDILKNARGEHLLLGSIGRENRVMPTFFRNWTESRQMKGIFLRILHKESVRKMMNANKPQMGGMMESRFLPKEIESPAVINIYGDRVVDVVWKGDSPICFMLINQDIADSYRKYFNYLWKMAEA